MKKIYLIETYEIDYEHRVHNERIVGAFETYASAQIIARAQPAIDGNPWTGEPTNVQDDPGAILAKFACGSSHTMTIKTINLYAPEDLNSLLPIDSEEVKFIKEIDRRRLESPSFKIKQAEFAKVLKFVESENLAITPVSNQFSYGYNILDPETAQPLLFLDKSSLPKHCTFHYMSRFFGTKRNKYLLKQMGFGDIQDEGHYEY